MGRPRIENFTARRALKTMSVPNGNQPATKAHVTALKVGLEDKITALENKMETGMQSMRDELIEAMRDMQTEVLRAFHAWARPTEIRLRGLDDLQQHVGMLEERVSAIERGDKPAA